MDYGMKGENVRRLNLKGSGAGCDSVPEISVTGDMVDVARRLPEINKTAHENRHS
jgi:hypothetical protein